ncbi:MAG: MFS transporter [Candidatus Thorarchaeota archaeon]
MNGQTVEPSKTPKSFRFIETTSYILFGLGPFVGNAVLTLLEAISSDFSVNATAVLIALPAFMIPFATFQLFAGAISDIYGRTKVIAGGLVGFIAGLFLISFATSIEIFALGNLVAGIGFGFVNPVILALLSDCAAPNDIPKRMGIASGLASLGVGLGPFVAGQIATIGWQYHYLLVLVIMFFGLIAILKAKSPERRIEGETGVKALINNLRIELRKPLVLLMLASTFFITLTYLGTMVWTSRGLTEVMDPTLLGLLLLFAGICGAAAGGVLGRMVKSIGYGISIVIGLVTLFMSIITLLLIDITAGSSILLVGISLALVGWAGGVLFPLMITIGQVISPERRGVLAGIVTSASFFGVAIVPSAFEPLFMLGMNTVYLGLLTISIVLTVFLSILYRQIATESTL